MRLNKNYVQQICYFSAAKAKLELSKMLNAGFGISQLPGNLILTKPYINEPVINLWQSKSYSLLYRSPKLTIAFFSKQKLTLFFSCKNVFRMTKRFYGGWMW